MNDSLNNIGHLRLPGCGESMNRGKSRFWGGGRRGPPRHCCSSWCCCWFWCCRCSCCRWWSHHIWKKDRMNIIAPIISIMVNISIDHNINHNIFLSHVYLCVDLVPSFMKMTCHFEICSRTQRFGTFRHTSNTFGDLTGKNCLNKTQCQLCKRLGGPIIPLFWSGLVK